MSEASLSRILADGARLPALAGLSNWLETITQDAIAKNRTNIITFPRRNRRATNDTSDASKPAA